jgi:hypothetical protein
VDPGGSGGNGPALHLASGSGFWVSPPDLDFTTRFTVTGTSAPDDYAVVATVFSPLQTRSAFDLTRRGAPLTGVLSETSQPVPLRSLADPLGGYTLTLAIHNGDGAPPAAGDASVDLGCDAGSCDGVYPLELRLVPLASGAPAATSGHIRSGTLLTYLVYAYPSGRKLDFSWLLPLGLPPVTAGPDGVPRVPSAASVNQLAALTGAVTSVPEVPVTLEPTPDSLATLRSSASARFRTVAAAVADAATLAGHEALAEGYVPVDAPALVRDGLGTELTAQHRRAGEVLEAMHPTTDTWTVDPDATSVPLAALTASGVTRLVVPPAAVTGGGCGVFTCTQPFAIGNSGVRAVFSDPGVQADLPSPQSPDPVLDAHRLLAELALVYFEQPNADDQRALVLATPPDWHASATFVRQLLQGLGANPVISPVTLAQVFATAPVGGNSSLDPQPATRASAGGTADDTLAGGALRATRERLRGFHTAVDAPVATQLSDLFLAAQASLLSPAEQRRAAGGVDAGIRAQLASLALPTAPIRLTSSAARVPITVTKSVPYRVEGTLTVSSDKLLFGPTTGCLPTRPANGGYTAVACRMVLDHNSNTVYVDMRSRASGDFRVSVVLESPGGSLVLTAGHLTVRSISTSAVAIALSAGAAAVLLGWWGRTLWRGRRSGRGAHVRARRT